MGRVTGLEPRHWNGDLELRQSSEFNRHSLEIEAEHVANSDVISVKSNGAAVVKINSWRRQFLPLTINYDEKNF